MGRQFALNAGSLWTVAVIKACLQLVLIPVMARLLGPTEFGLYALALPTLAFFMTLTDGGLGASLSREPETSEVVWSTAFWLLLGSGFVMAACVTLAAVVFAYLSGEPRLFGIMALLSTSLIFVSLSVVPDARLLRRGNLIYHSGADLVSSVIGAVVAVSMASMGIGAMSLVGQYVTVWAVRALVLNLVAFEVPLLRFDLPLLRGHVLIGGGIVGRKLVESLGQFLENIIIGRSFGPAALGSINLANQIARFLCDSSSNPVWASLYSHSLQGGGARSGALHARLSRLLGTALFPATVILAACAPQVFGLLFGAQWSESIPMIQVMLPLNAVCSVASLSGALILADGRSGLLLIISVGTTLTRLIAIFSASFISPFAIACAGGVVIFAQAFVMLFVLSSVTRQGVGYAKLLRDVAGPFGASVVGASAYLLTLRTTAGGIGGTTVSLLMAALSYGCALVVIDGRRLFGDIQQIRTALFAR